MEITVGSAKFRLIKGDITTQDTEAIVNAANSGLLGGGGVDGAIHRAGGPRILQECKKIRSERGKLPVGQAVITAAGNLLAKYVIHTVGPVWHGGEVNEERLLQSAYLNSLRLAAEYQLHSISFPSISTGAYRFPVARAAGIAMGAVLGFLKDSRHQLKEVRFVLFSQNDLEIYQEALRRAKESE